MPNPQKSPVHDLRSALELLKTLPGELVSTDVEVDPIAELSGVYRYVGAGGTCQRPTSKNGPAMLFVSAKVSQLALLPQGRVEATRRAKAMVAKMDELGFGNCTNTRACEVECPKNISITNIARLNREFLAAKFKD